MKYTTYNVQQLANDNIDYFKLEEEQEETEEE